MQLGERSLIVVGDRVLVRPEEGDSTTNAGLVLPASVADREAVQTGRIVAVGPGLAVAPSGLDLDDDAWRRSGAEARYVAMQARVGDLAAFFRKAAIEITVDQERFLVVSHGALLVLLRDHETREPTSRHPVN